MAVGEGEFELGVGGEADDGAIGEDALVGGVVVGAAQLEHEVTAAQIQDERLQVGGMPAAAVEEGAEPRTHGRLTVVAGL